MEQYIEILDTAKKENVDVYEVDMRGNLKGLYYDNVIFINKNMAFHEKKSVLCEELSHHLYTVGDILDKKSIVSIKQENFARRKSYEYLVPLSTIQEAIKDCDNMYQLADKLNIEESFLNHSIEYYIAKFGTIYNVTN